MLRQRTRVPCFTLILLSVTKRNIMLGLRRGQRMKLEATGCVLLRYQLQIICKHTEIFLLFVLFPPLALGVKTFCWTKKKLPCWFVIETSGLCCRLQCCCTCRTKEESVCHSSQELTVLVNISDIKSTWIFYFSKSSNTTM